MHTDTNKKTVTAFIGQVWNGGDFSVLPELLADDYRDYSFLPQLPPTREGLELWVKNTSQAFDHHTTIESMAAEGDLVAVHVRLHVKHTGTWRSLAPTGKEVAVKGFRFFRMKNGKIAEQHALIDGEALYHELSGTYQGCTVGR